MSAQSAKSSNKTKNKQPANFVDLRGKPKSQSQSFQDIISPELKHSYRLGFNWLQRLSRVQRIVGVVVIVCLVAIAVSLFGSSSDPVPLSVRKAVSFKVYYPLQSNLPNGYTLDTTSFTTTKQTVIYAVDYDNGQKINVSVQAQPSAAQLSYFNSHYIAVHSDLSTAIGTAVIGSIDSQSVVSLPAGKSWILLVAPGNINQTALKQTVQALVPAQ